MYYTVVGMYTTMYVCQQSMRIIIAQLYVSTITLCMYTCILTTYYVYVCILTTCLCVCVTMLSTKVLGYVYVCQQYVCVCVILHQYVCGCAHPSTA